MRLDPRTRAYSTRRRDEGLSRREVTRRVQRYVARDPRLVPVQPYFQCHLVDLGEVSIARPPMQKHPRTTAPPTGPLCVALCEPDGMARPDFRDAAVRRGHTHVS